MYYIGNIKCLESDVKHFGIQGMKWGVRRYQNPDGTLTEEGKARYYIDYDGTYKKRDRRFNKNFDKEGKLTKAGRAEIYKGKDGVYRKRDFVTSAYRLGKSNGSNGVAIALGKGALTQGVLSVVYGTVNKGAGRVIPHSQARTLIHIGSSIAYGYLTVNNIVNTVAETAGSVSAMKKNIKKDLKENKD